MSEQIKGIDKLLTQDEAAELLGVKKVTLARWRWTEEGPAYVKMGGKVMYERKAILAYIKKRTVVHDAA